MIIKFADFQIESVDFEVFPKEVDEDDYMKEMEHESFDQLDDKIINFDHNNGHGGNITYITQGGSTPYRTYQICIRKKRKYTNRKLGYGRGIVTVHYRFYKFWIDKFEDEYYSIRLKTEHAIRVPSDKERASSHSTTEDRYWIADQRDELKSFINKIQEFSKTGKIDFI